MVFGIIDIGSNSIKLLVAESTSTLAMRSQTTWETRIGGGLGRSQPYLTKDAIDNGIQAIQSLIEGARDYRVNQYYLVATSAVRDASNREAFVERILEQTGHRLQVLSGDEEAAYIAHGIVTDPELLDYNDFCLIDLGGGSLEGIHIQNKQAAHKVSLQLGAVRLMEQCVKHPDLPMKRESIQAITREVRDAFDRSGFVFPKDKVTLVGTGGALSVARSIRAAWLGRSFEAIGNVLSLRYLEYLFLELGSLSTKERMRVPHLPKERADILPTGLLILITVAELAGQKQYLHSLHNLRYGIAAHLHRELAEGNLSSDL